MVAAKVEHNIIAIIIELTNDRNPSFSTSLTGDTPRPLSI